MVRFGMSFQVQVCAVNGNWWFRIAFDGWGPLMESTRSQFFEVLDFLITNVKPYVQKYLPDNRDGLFHHMIIACFFVITLSILQLLK